MKRLTETKLPYRREAYRLWFEYLRVARRSSDKEVQAALIRSKDFYAPWGDIFAANFDQWWKANGHLFEEKYVVRQLMPGEQPADPSALIVEIPLTQSPTKLTKLIGKIIQDASAKRQQGSTTRKSKKQPTSTYRVTTGAEPKLGAVKEMLTVYRDVFMKNEHLRGAARLEKVHAFYLGRRNKRWAKVPTPLLYPKYGDNTTALRNLNRYITKARRVVLNVANGKFP